MDVMPGGSVSNANIVPTSNGNDVSGNAMNKSNEKSGDWNQSQMYPSNFSFGVHTSSHGYQHTSTPSNPSASTGFKNFSSRQNDWAMHASSVYSSMASGSFPIMQTLHPDTAAAIQSSFDPGVLGLVACRKGEGQTEQNASRPQSVSIASSATSANTWHMPSDDGHAESDQSLVNEGQSAPVGKISTKGPYKCKTCGEIFAKRDGLRAHRRAEHSLGAHKCTECDKVFSHRSHLQQHVRIHTGEKLYKCQLCHKEFIHSGSLSNHMKSHAAEANKNATTLEKMRSSSLARTDSESDAKESASEDGSKSDLRRMPFVCHCGKKFACFAKLQLHERVHTGERPYQCDLCDRAFAEKGNLEKHKRTHTRETPYLCRECGETFCHSYQLKRHSLKHNGDVKPFVCNQCGRGFLQEAKLHLHMRIHTGEKPYICSICDKRFSEKGNLTQHQRTHSSEKPYQCDHCNKSFAHSTGLRTHRKRHNLPISGSATSTGKSSSIGVGPNKKMYVDSAVQTYTVVGPSVETYGMFGEPFVDRPPTFAYDKPHVLQRQDLTSIDPRYTMVHQEAMTSVGFDSRPASAHNESRTPVNQDGLTSKVGSTMRSSGVGEPSMAHKMPSVASSSLDSRGMEQHVNDSRSLSMRPMDMRALDVRSSSALMHTAVTAGREVISRSGYLTDMVPNSGVELRNVLAAAQENLNNRGSSHLRLPSSLMPDMMSMGAMDARLSHSQTANSVSGVELRCALGQDLTSPGVDSVSFSP